MEVFIKLSKIRVYLVLSLKLVMLIVDLTFQNRLRGSGHGIAAARMDAKLNVAGWVSEQMGGVRWDIRNLTHTLSFAISGIWKDCFYQNMIVIKFPHVLVWVCCAIC